MSVFKRFDFNLWFFFIIFLFICLILLFFSNDVFASSDGILDDVTEKFKRHLNPWYQAIMPAVARLFWVLVLISMVFQFGFMLYDGLDLHKLFGSFLRLIIVSGLLYWILLNGPKIMMAIINSFTKLGGTLATSAGINEAAGASKIMELGLNTAANLIAHGNPGFMPSVSAGILSVTAALLVLIIFSIVAVNITIEYIVTWCVIYIGVISLGFGGLFITRDWAIAYIKMTIAQGLKLLTIFAIIAVSYDIINGYLSTITNNGYSDIGNMCKILVYAIIMLFLIQRVPNVVASLVGGPTNTNMSIVGSVAAGVGIGKSLGTNTVSGINKASDKLPGMGEKAGSIKGASTATGMAQQTAGSAGKTGMSNLMTSASGITSTATKAAGAATGVGAVAQAAVGIASAATKAATKSATKAGGTSSDKSSSSKKS